MVWIISEIIGGSVCNRAIFNSEVTAVESMKLTYPNAKIDTAHKNILISTFDGRRFVIQGVEVNHEARDFRNSGRLNGSF